MTQETTRFAEEDDRGFTLPNGRRVDFSLVEIKERARASKSLQRWKKTEAGYTLPNGVHLDTNKNVRDTLAQCILAIDQGIKAEPFNYKGSSGWVSLSREDVVQTAALINAYVQQCFDEEMAAGALIDAATTIEQVLAI